MHFIDTKKRYEIEIGLETETVVLRRRHIPISYVKENDEILKNIQDEYVKDKDFPKFCFAMLSQMCDNFEPLKFEGVDVFILKDIIAAFAENDRVTKRPEEKKSV